MPVHCSLRDAVLCPHQRGLSSLFPSKRQLLPQSCSLLLCSAEAGAHIL